MSIGPSLVTFSCAAQSTCARATSIVVVAILVAVMSSTSRTGAAGASPQFWVSEMYGLGPW